MSQASFSLQVISVPQLIQPRLWFSDINSLFSKDQEFIKK